MTSALNGLKARALTILVWAAIILAIFGLVSYNRSVQTSNEADLTSTAPATVDATTLKLVQSNRLIDVLANTQNPNEAADSPANKRSIVIRKNATDAVNRLVDAKRIDVDPAFNTLFLLCKDGNGDVKTAAKAGLAKLGGADNANLQKVVMRLKDGDPDIRGAAVDVLGAIGGDKTAKAVDAVLKDPASQDSAMSAMVKFKTPNAPATQWIPDGAPAVPYLLARLSDPDIQYRQQIVDLLRQVGSPGAIPNLATVAADTSQPAVRRIALVALSNTVLNVYNAEQKALDDDKKSSADKAKALKDPKTAAAYKAPVPLARPTPADLAQVRSATPILVAALNNQGDDSEARAQAALALGRLATPEATVALVKALSDDDNRVKQQALIGVETVGATAVGPLTTALHSGDPAARPAAAEALGGIGTPAAIQTLSADFTNPATPTLIRQRAAVGLGASGAVAAIPLLVRALGDADGTVASAAQDALVLPALRQQAIPALVSSFSLPTPVPYNASATLARMEDQALPALETAARSASPTVQTWAAVSLGLSDSRKPDVLTTLTPLKTSANPSVQWAATQALDRLTGS